MDVLTIASQRQRAGPEQQQKRKFNIANAPENAGNFSKKIGRFFTFVKFLETLVKCAKMTFSGYSTGSESQIYQGYKINQELLESEMVCLLLERMELSKGFNTLE